MNYSANDLMTKSQAMLQFNLSEKMLEYVGEPDEIVTNTVYAQAAPTRLYKRARLEEFANIYDEDIERVRLDRMKNRKLTKAETKIYHQRSAISENRVAALSLVYNHEVMINGMNLSYDAYSSLPNGCWSNLRGDNKSHFVRRVEKLKLTNVGIKEVQEKITELSIFDMGIYLTLLDVYAGSRVARLLGVTEINDIALRPNWQHDLSVSIPYLSSFPFETVNVIGLEHMITEGILHYLNPTWKIPSEGLAK